MDEGVQRDLDLTPNPLDTVGTPHTLSPGYGLNELGEIAGRKKGTPQGAWIVFGGQAGSEGKGAIAGYLARKHEWGAAICTFMTNAGHTFVDGDEEVVVQQLPMAIVSPSVEHLLIGPGSAITLPQLEKEIEAYDRDYDVVRRLRIHPRAMIIEDIDQAWEEENLQYIASTAKGCGSALARKVRRSQNVKMARDVEWLAPFIADTTMIANDVIDNADRLLVEQAQGFDLDLNHGVSYPYCTSRGTTPMQIMADIGVDGRLVMRSIAVVRSHPIRVGDVEGGTSGPYGSEETDWDKISAQAGKDVEEITTVTKRVRRVFEPDYDRLSVMSQIARPTDIAFTFADYVDPEIGGASGDKRSVRWANRSSKLQKAIFDVEKAVSRSTARPRVRLVKTGPDNSHMIDLMGPATV